MSVQVTWLPATDMFVCREYWPSRTSRQFFTTASLVFQYLAPGSIITFCYVKVRRFVTMTHFDPLKLSDGQILNLGQSKTADGRHLKKH